MREATDLRWKRLISNCCPNCGQQGPRPKPGAAPTLVACPGCQYQWHPIPTA